MNPTKVDRNHLLRLTDLPNVGPACEKDLRLIGIRVPAHLRGRDPYDMYAQLCLKTGVMHDPCVIDVFLSVVRFMADEVLVMKDGDVVEQAGVDAILEHPREAYTRRLLAAVPRGWQAAAG